MPCNYQRKTGARSYKNYTEEIMMKALEDVPKLGLKGSSRLHKIPYGYFSIRFMENITSQLEHLNGMLK